MSTDVIEQDGIYEDAEGNRFQYRKGTVLPEGVKETLKRAGDFPEPQEPGVEEYQTTVEGTDAKAAPAVDNKAAPRPQDKTDR